MAQIESTPFFLNTAYGLYNHDQTLIKNRFFKILNVLNDERADDPGGGSLRTITLRIQYKRGKNDPDLINLYGVTLYNYSNNNKYFLFFNDGIVIPHLLVSIEPLNQDPSGGGAYPSSLNADSDGGGAYPSSPRKQGGGHRNGKSTKRVSRRRRNKTTRRRT